MIEPLGPVILHDSPKLLDDLSGLVVFGDWLYLVDDEDDRVRKYLRTSKPYEFEYVDDPGFRVNDDNKEADLEGISLDGNRLYVLGSHSCRRKKPKAGNSPKENRERIERVEPPGLRDVLVRFELSSQGLVKSREFGLLREILDDQLILKPFLSLPSKENGVDLEGLAVRDDRLMIGFRGPVFHDGLVPLLECKWKDKLKFERLLLVQLGGRGIRDIVHVRGGYLILAGAMNVLHTTFALYFWSGETEFLAECSQTVFLGNIPVLNSSAKAEGIWLESECDQYYTIWVAFDGVPDGGITRMRVSHIQKEQSCV